MCERVCVCVLACVCVCVCLRACGVCVGEWVGGRGDGGRGRLGRQALAVRIKRACKHEYREADEDEKRQHIAHLQAQGVGTDGLAQNAKQCIH
jgi:hypothetical protein